MSNEEVEVEGEGDAMDFSDGMYKKLLKKYKSSFIRVLWRGIGKVEF